MSFLFNNKRCISGLFFCGTGASLAHFRSSKSIGRSRMRRSVDREKIARADREARIVIDAERQARDAKTLRLKAQRLKMQAGLSKPAESSEPASKKLVRHISEVE
ncbi:hypothetical protein ACWGTI_22705 [Mesorhizobium sp. ArgA1]